MPSSPGPVGSTRMAFRMTIGLPRPGPGYPHHTGLISASCTSNPRFRHRLSSDPALRRTPLPRRMVPVITVHRGLPPPECTSLLDTPGETACPTLLDQSFGEVGGAGGFACRWKLISIAHPNPENGYAPRRGLVVSRQSRNVALVCETARTRPAIPSSENSLCIADWRR